MKQLLSALSAVIGTLTLEVDVKCYYNFVNLSLVYVFKKFSEILGLY